MKVLRVCAALIRGDGILMVLHRHDGREYWTLPGGGVEVAETPVDAVVREVDEETGLTVTVDQPLFDEPFKHGLCRCFSVKCDELSEAVLGFDPEESHLAEAQQMLQSVAWHRLEDVGNDVQVRQVIAALGL